MSQPSCAYVFVCVFCDVLTWLICGLLLVCTGFRTRTCHHGKCISQNFAQSIWTGASCLNTSRVSCVLLRLYRCTGYLSSYSVHTFPNLEGAELASMQDHQQQSCKSQQLWLSVRKQQLSTQTAEAAERTEPGALIMCSLTCCLRQRYINQGERLSWKGL